MTSRLGHPDPHSVDDDSVSLDGWLMVNADQDQASSSTPDPSMPVDKDLMPPTVEELWPAAPASLADDSESNPPAVPTEPKHVDLGAAATGVEVAQAEGPSPPPSSISHEGNAAATADKACSFVRVAQCALAVPIRRLTSWLTQHSIETPAATEGGRSPIPVYPSPQPP